MQRTAIVRLAAAGLLGVVLTVAACQQSRPSEIPARGHEDGAPNVTHSGPVPDEASRQPEISVKPREPSECLKPDEAVRSVRKTVPDAAIVNHLAGASAANFISRFNAERGATVTGDEVIVIDSSRYADAAVAVFVANHCVLRTLAFQPATPNHADE